MLTRPFVRRIPLALAGATLVSLLWPILADAILVAPTAVFMDHRTRSGELYLVNRGSQPEEVSIGLRYGYPDVDSAGGVYIHFFDSLPAGAHSAAEWVRAYPRRVVVPPGAQQMVRLMATPPADLADGEYWSRIVVTSRQAAAPIAVADSGVRAQINVEVRTIISLIYRKGDVRTGLDLGDFRAALRGDSLEVWMDLTRSGSGAWLGTARVTLQDPQGATGAQEWDTQIAVYAPMRRRLAFPVGRLGPGTYTVRLLLSTAREDIPQASVLPTPPIERATTVAVAVP